MCPAGLGDSTPTLRAERSGVSVGCAVPGGPCKAAVAGSVRGCFRKVGAVGRGRRGESAPVPGGPGLRVTGRALRKGCCYRVAAASGSANTPGRFKRKSVSPRCSFLP